MTGSPGYWGERLCLSLLYRREDPLRATATPCLLPPPSEAKPRLMILPRKFSRRLLKANRRRWKMTGWKHWDGRLDLKPKTQARGRRWIWSHPSGAWIYSCLSEACASAQAECSFLISTVKMPFQPLPGAFKILFQLWKNPGESISVYFHQNYIPFENSCGVVHPHGVSLTDFLSNLDTAFPPQMKREPFKVCRVPQPCSQFSILSDFSLFLFYYIASSFWATKCEKRDWNVNSRSLCLFLLFPTATPHVSRVKTSATAVQQQVILH